MTTTSPHGNQNQSSCTKVPVPTEGLPLDPKAQDQDKASNPTPDLSKETKIGSDPNPNGPSVYSNSNLAKIYTTVEDKENTTLDEINNKICDYSQKLGLKMSPVEGPVNDIPKNNEAVIVKISNNSQNGKFEKSKNADDIDGEEFSGQIVYNPDGSAYILEESDETLLEQIPTQEGAIVERAGKHSSEVEYPRIDQAIYIARRRAWYNAMGNAYLQMMQEKCPESPVIHNFKVVSVNDKTTLKVKKEQKTSEETSEGKGPDHKLEYFLPLIVTLLFNEIKIIFNVFLTSRSSTRVPYHNKEF